MTKTVITSDKAPAAIGTYSQAIKAGNTVYMSGQIPLDPKTMELVEGFEAQTVQVFENLKAVAEAAGGSFKDIVKLNIFLTDLSHFAKVNEVMGRYIDPKYIDVFVACKESELAEFEYSISDLEYNWYLHTV